MKSQHPGRYLWLYSFVELTLILLVALLGASSAQLDNLSIEEKSVDLVWVKGKVKTQKPAANVVVRIESGEKPYVIQAGTISKNVDLANAISQLREALVKPVAGSSRLSTVEVQPTLNSASLHYFQLARELEDLCVMPTCSVQVLLDHRD